MTSTTMQVPSDALRGGEGEVHGVLRDGSTVRIRSVTASDIVPIRAFLVSLSAESRLLRFFSGGLDIERTAQWVAHPEAHDGYALVATTGTDQRIIAHGSFERWHPDDARAEVALAVSDSHQNLGLGTLLVGRLAEIASGHGIAVFIAHVLAQNHRMVRVLRNAGFPLTQRTVAGDIEIEFSTALTPEGRRRFDHREQVAATAAVRRVLAPTSVAVIGASRRRGKPGGAVFHNLITSGFAGPVYPVNSRASVVQSVPAYRSVAEVPGTVDLAVIAVPAEQVLTVARECTTVGVRALVVLSAGFGETDDSGRQRQSDLLEMCRQSGVRLLGPNCLGVVNTDPAVGLNAQFGPTGATRGRVGLLSQRGLLGPAIIDRANDLGLGLSSFVSIGNKADLSSNDLLHYWEGDPQTDVILLDVGSFGNPRRFSRIARRLTRTKPIVAVRSGRSPADVRAPSRAGALLAASERTVDALFHQAGVIRTDTLSELFDVARLLVGQPVPAGSRVGIISNAGGPGIKCADACAAEGLNVVGLSDATRGALRTVLPAQATVGNPVDTAAAVTPNAYREAIRVLGASGEVDALITIYVPRLAGDAVRFAAAPRDAAGQLDDRVAVMSVFMSSLATATTTLRGDTRIPMYAFPEDAVRALAHASRLGQRQRMPDGRFGEPAGVRHNEASALLAEATRAGPHARWLTPPEVGRLFDCYGIRLVEEHTASSIDEAVETARAIGDPGVELLIGVTADATFGPVVVCGAGGATVEHPRDLAVRIAPLTTRDAHDMLRELATFPLLDRGAPQADVAAVEDLLLRVSAMAEHQRAIAELDCPVVVTGRGALVIAARVLVEGSRPFA